MRILFLNWRDIKNPKSGGAEILTHEIAKKLVQKKHNIIQFSSFFPHARSHEVIDGVEIIRKGHPDLRTLFSSVHFKAYQYYKKKKFGEIDLVIDEIHGMPFFTPLYVKEEKIAFICEYAGSLWNKAVAFPFNYFGRIAEVLYPNLYRGVKVITISDSSKKEIQKNLFPKVHISVIHPGCSTPIFKGSLKKRNRLTLVFIARLSKTKGVEDALEIVRIIKESESDVVLHVIGRGDGLYVSDIKRIVENKQITKNVIFHGFVTEKKKINLIDRSHFLITTSQKEGWGLTVHEANSRGVPVISYNVGGLKDIVKNGINGFLCKRNTPAFMARTVLTLFKDKKMYNKLRKSSIEERKKYTWKKTVQEFLKIVHEGK